MGTETHEILFSFDQSGHMLNPLLAVLQQASAKLHNLLAQKSIKGTYVVLVIDLHQERGHYLAYMLTKAGYRTVIASTTLQAFTLFLQNSFVPVVIIMAQEDSTNHFLLHRIIQQTMQKYSWEVVLVRLHIAQEAQTTTSNAQPMVTPPDIHVSSQPTGPLALVPPRPSPDIPQQSPPFGQQPSAPQSGPLSMPQSPMTPEQIREMGAWKKPGEQTPLKNAPSGPLSSWGQTEVPAQSSAENVPYISKIPSAPLFAQEKYAPQKAVEKVSLKGQSLGRYHIQSLLGSGLLGDVYQTYDRLREDLVALKAMQVDSLPYYIIEKSMEEATHFQQEAELLSKITHPHILPSLNTGKSYISGSPFIYKTMRYCEEGSLASWLQRNGSSRSFQPGEVISVVVQLADAIQHAHNQHILFLNFKLSNILVLNQAEKFSQLQVALTDFSVVQDGTFFSRTPGAYPYMAPERWHGQALPASDQYALAALAYELLAGRPMFQGNAEHVMRLLHMNMLPQSPSVFNPAVSLATSNVLLRALVKRPEERFASVATFINAFQRSCM